MKILDVHIVKKNLSTIKDNSCINITSGRRIKWTQTKEKKMYFNRILQICCPKAVEEKVWSHYVDKLTTPSKKINRSRADKYDYFDWASDQDEPDVLNKRGYKDYILS